MRIVAIITARGGSKRIPRKNIKEFCGKPIIEYSISAALNSDIFDEVMVSTDDEEIADIAISCGAKVPFMRSKKTSDDFATTEDVIKEVIEMYQEQGEVFDSYCCIYPTAPFLTSEKLNRAIKEFISSGASFLTPVVKFSYPPQRCMIIKDNTLKMKWPEYMKIRSQDLESCYHDCGQFYIGNIEKFFMSGMSSGFTLPFIIPESEVQDIDTEEDWKIAEMKYKLMQNN